MIKNITGNAALKNKNIKYEKILNELNKINNEIKS